MGSLKGPRASRFQEIISTGDRASTKSFTIFALNGTGFVGITTSKKLGCHARRNRVKRRMKEVVRLSSKLMPNHDLVVLAREEAGLTKFEILVTEYADLVNELELRWAKQLESS